MAGPAPYTIPCGMLAMAPGIIIESDKTIRIISAGAPTRFLQHGSGCPGADKRLARNGRREKRVRIIIAILAFTSWSCIAHRTMAHTHNNNNVDMGMGGLYKIVQGT